MTGHRGAVAIGLILLALVMLAVASCSSSLIAYTDGESVPPLGSTWTPTPAGGSAEAIATPAAGENESPPSTDPDLPAGPTPIRITVPVEVVKALHEPTATPQPRIDTAGPIEFPMIAPLPIGQGRPPVRLIIPALTLDTPVLPMGWHRVSDRRGQRTEWDVVDNAAGHHIDTVYPGEQGNVVLSGHNNVGGAVFQSVSVIGEPGVDFGLGDSMILVDELGRRFVYTVNGWERLKEANASVAKRVENARYLRPTDFAQLTLVTCWPPDSNTHRVVVTGLLTGAESIP
ncbi:MAG: sortase [Caldilineales bacterium]|nr:sortase [Caldilineales bacterium]